MRYLRLTPPQPVVMQFTLHELAEMHTALTTLFDAVPDLKNDTPAAWRAVGAIAAALKRQGCVLDEKKGWLR